MREGRDIESNRISNEVRAISLDGNKYSSITENAENENNDQAMNVKNENRITPFSDNVPSGSSVNIPVPDIAAKIEPIIPSKATEKGMCGDRPSLEVKIVSSKEDRKWQSNTTRPTARGKSLPTRRTVIISKSGSKKPCGAGEVVSLHAKKSSSGAKIDRYKYDRRRRNSVNGNSNTASFIDLT